MACLIREETMQKNIIIGFIGFGEAAYHICLGLHETSQPHIIAFDIMWEDKKLQERAKQVNVTLVSSLASLIAASDIIICATSASHALDIAQEASLYLSPQKIYADINSASPKTKQNIAHYIEETGARFVDCGVMEIVIPYKHKVPIAASGSGAKEFAEALNALGMHITYIDEKVGSASSLKMFRSIFMKGMTSLLIETLLAAYRMGVCDQLMASISQTVETQSLEKLANLLINRTAVAAKRRVAEMEEVIEMLKTIKVEPFTSTATKSRLQWMEHIGLKEYFHASAPDDYHEVLKACWELTRHVI